MADESGIRPWGEWYVLKEDVGYKVKLIRVASGCRLSYQSHRYRSEHWVVLSGHATCLIDDVSTVAGPGASVDVAVGAKHRLANEGAADLFIVEVQRGPYTGEDDIVRIEDDYGRCGAALQPETAVAASNYGRLR